MLGGNRCRPRGSHGRGTSTIPPNTHTTGSTSTGTSTSTSSTSSTSSTCCTSGGCGRPDRIPLDLHCLGCTRVTAAVTVAENHEHILLQRLLLVMMMMIMNLLLVRLLVLRDINATRICPCTDLERR